MSEPSLERDRRFRGVADGFLRCSTRSRQDFTWPTPWWFVAIKGQRHQLDEIDSRQILVRRKTLHFPDDCLDAIPSGLDVSFDACIERSENDHPSAKHDEKRCDRGSVALPDSETDQRGSDGDQDNATMLIEPPGPRLGDRPPSRLSLTGDGVGRVSFLHDQ
jgi:hypothetical protein